MRGGWAAVMLSLGFRFNLHLPRGANTLGVFLGDDQGGLDAAWSCCPADRQMELHGAVFKQPVEGNLHDECLQDKFQLIPI